MVKPGMLTNPGPATFMKQGYLSVDPHRTVRIRIEGESAWITIKGKLTNITRPEFEYRIPLAEAEEIMQLIHYPPVEKVRYRVEVGGVRWDVDEFRGENAGLIIAEIELDNEEQQFTRPEWLGEEVTHDKRYYNYNLAKRPFSRW